MSSPEYDSKEHHYLMRAEEAQNSMTELTDRICNTVGGTLLVMRVQGLDLGDVNPGILNGLKTPLYKYADHVLYDPRYVELQLADSCGHAARIRSMGVPDERWIGQLLNSDAKVTILDIFKTDSDQLAESFQKLASVYAPENLIIQGLPTFERPNTLLRSASRKLQKLGRLTNQQWKREDLDEEDDEAAEFAEEEIEYEEEMDSYFNEINDMLADGTAEGEDERFGSGEVGADSVQEDAASKKKKKKTGDDFVTPDGSLFDKYAFVSSGLWMGIIVSLCLFSIIAVAYSWINDIHISYAAFDKPVSAQKKTQ